MSKKIKKEIIEAEIIMNKDNLFSSDVAFTDFLLDKTIYKQDKIEKELKKYSDWIFSLRKGFVENGKITLFGKTILMKKTFIIKEKPYLNKEDDSWNNYEIYIKKILENNHPVLFFDYFIIVSSVTKNKKLKIEILNSKNSLNVIADIKNFKNKNKYEMNDVKENLTKIIKINKKGKKRWIKKK